VAEPQALVILPFADVARAESFVAMLNANPGNEENRTAAAIVTLGTAYEWEAVATDTHGQVVKFRAGWESFIDPDEDDTVLLQRITRTADSGLTEEPSGEAVDLSP